MKVWQVSFSDAEGGAARAAYRLHCALRASGLESTMHVSKAQSGDWTVRSRLGIGLKLGASLRPAIATQLCRLLDAHEIYPSSLSLLRSRWPRLINNSDADLVNLHWVCAEMMSVADIGRITKPLVWTLHDMWAFCGTEHYTESDRWREGYLRRNRPDGEGGLDLNRWTWSRKKKRWSRKLHIVAPSTWLAECVSQSALMHDWPVCVIPNALDTDKWKPIPVASARELLDLPADIPLIAFGAIGGGRDPNKGFDVLKSALARVARTIPTAAAVVFGESTPRNPERLGMPIRYLGHLRDDITLRLVYSAADVLVIPSRIENLSNVATEALSCGTPLAAFNSSGMRDVVVHEQTGWLADPFSEEDLARGIEWILGDRVRQREMSENARAFAVSKFSSRMVADRYRALYEQVAQGG